ncbi:universal stress protein [Streptomyces neyagawaensis]|uniref:universal stress protein n=1 Tax=Streptomyces neyagawaensis TaxID=42238 RepID=UPI0006E224EC|nr:universal stress protein [Streptomyces neyagawaensis]MCL6735866.1 universal stress protein [Streptomyces neyagawaensis]MDE1686328.1 universal stress protein [Streptomyces neyagawaensis]
MEQTELPLVVGVDGSEPSLRVVDRAADEAAPRGVPLRLVHASLWEWYEGAAPAEDLGKPSELVLADRIVDGAARRAHSRQPDLKVFTEVVPEEPEYALVRECRRASALVVGNRGRGDIAEFLLGVGKQAHDSAAVRFAFEEAERRGAVLEAVRARRCPAHETPDHPLLAGEPARVHGQRGAETLEAALNEVAEEHPSVQLHRRTDEGPARKIRLDASATADLLVVGARRNKGPFGLGLGRVAHTLLHHSACPVAVVPHTA